MRYSRVCLELVDLRMVPLLHESRTLNECANIEDEKEAYKEVNQIYTLHGTFS